MYDALTDLELIARHHQAELRRHRGAGRRHRLPQPGRRPA
jgi:hypothetical protein